MARLLAKRHPPVVYFAALRFRDLNLVKIGATGNLFQRLAVLRQRARDVRLLGVMPGGLAEERAALDRFEKHGVRIQFTPPNWAHEFFANVPEIASFVREQCVSPDAWRAENGFNANAFRPRTRAA